MMPPFPKGPWITRESDTIEQCDHSTFDKEDSPVNKRRGHEGESPIDRWKNAVETLPAFLAAGQSSVALDTLGHLRMPRLLDKFDWQWANAPETGQLHRSHDHTSHGNEEDGILSSRQYHDTIRPTRSSSQNTAWNTASEKSTTTEHFYATEDDSATESLSISSHLDGPGLSESVTDKTWFHELCRVVNAVYSDWRNTRGSRAVRPDYRETDLGKRSRGDTGTQQQSAGKIDENGGGQSKKAGKRKVLNDNSRIGDDGRNDGSNDEDGIDINDRKRLRPEVPERRFACPFYKHDNVRHAGCLLRRLTRVRDVKQHLRCAHRRPPFCPVCGEEFVLQDRLEDHIRGRTCQEQDFDKPEGITEKQSRDLSGRVLSKATPTAQWFSIWDIVFPGEARPDSPFVYGAVERICHEFVPFYDCHALGIIETYFESRPPSTSSESVSDDIQRDSRLVYTVGRVVVADLARRMMEEDINDNASICMEASADQGQEETLSHAPSASVLIPERTLPGVVAPDEMASHLSNFTERNDTELINTFLSFHCAELSQEQRQTPEDTHDPTFFDPDVDPNVDPDVDQHVTGQLDHIQDGSAQLDQLPEYVEPLNLQLHGLWRQT
ncbi:hypothetical protein Micbo1qcDRAFT_179836 [Microdochium bolleyi]|uniref:C2H2-type domain-containing protein n=1 Tax=Microdochium bolleyi TaxID=196109 RepID=A0A136INS8_9PEZI|nr:hypothetical protein Micbo1qcDRAFT_179836 [Microdochium bolleyi]